MWATVQTKNDWGGPKTFLEANDIEYPIEEKEYQFRLPDGSQHFFLIERRKIYTQSPDHGHINDYINIVPFVTIDYHGAKISIKLYKLDCEIWI